MALSSMFATRPTYAVTDTTGPSFTRWMAARNSGSMKRGARLTDATSRPLETMVAVTTDSSRVTKSRWFFASKISEYAASISVGERGSNATMRGIWTQTAAQYTRTSSPLGSAMRAVGQKSSCLPESAKPAAAAPV
jgi:hypothetical protein